MYYENGVKVKLGQEDFVKGVVSFIYIKESNSLIVARMTFNYEFQIYFSNLDEEDLSFQREKFELEEGTDPGKINLLRFLDYDVGSFFVSINRNQYDSYTEDLFVSDIAHGDFKLSLKSVVSNLYDGTIDFVEVGVSGVYVANQWENNQKVTRISFNNGGDWYPLQAPDNNTCVGTCYLHLHGPTSSLTNEFYTRSSAVGTILAVGNIGEYQIENLTDTDIFISRDGGREWKFFHDGDRRFELLNRGSVIVMVRNNNTTAIEYTTNLGVAWNECGLLESTDITHDSFEVLNLSPSANDTKPVLNILTRSEANGTSFKLWSLDFSSLLPECTDEDYELFSPRGEDNECILGEKTQYYRLKEGSNCRITKDIEIAVTKEFCNCTDEDYVCNFCYDNVEGVCTISSQCTTSDASPPPDNCTFGDSYIGRPSHRRVAGTKCINDIASYLTPLEYPCPLVITTSTSTSSSSSSSEETSVETSEVSSSDSEGIESGDNLSEFERSPVLTITLGVFVLGLAALLVVTIFLYLDTSVKQLR
eukprot:TRINITY_DN2369_c0_g2_i2.p1 TRINITY_DN2369_c0_g2~~TRINITY_DN2369_c0_g2_i2.p1  ORF type:complete len:533 (-),score=115.07 TRINITY_DN2369_c0_g2_i2:3-1601(-)